MPELNNQPADDNEDQPQPGGDGDVFFKDKAPSQNADEREDGHVNPQQPRKIPFNEIDHQPVATQYYESDHNEDDALIAQPLANERVATDFIRERLQEISPW